MSTDLQMYFNQMGRETFVPPHRDEKSVPLPNTASGFVEIFCNTKRSICLKRDYSFWRIEQLGVSTALKPL